MNDMVEVGAYEAKTHLPDLLRKVRSGLRFTITQRGEAVADLVPTGAATRRSGAQAAGRMRRFMRQPNAHARSGGPPVDIKALINEGRD